MVFIFFHFKDLTQRCIDFKFFHLFVYCCFFTPNSTCYTSITNFENRVWL